MEEDFNYISVVCISQECPLREKCSLNGQWSYNRNCCNYYIQCHDCEFFESKDVLDLE